MKKATYTTIPGLLAMAALVAACSSAPTTTSLLDQTRGDYMAAQSNPIVSTYAPREFREASAALEAAIGISGTDLRKLVNRMRRKGVPIGSDRCGYFYAATAGEVYSTIQQLQNMENGLAAARRGLERSLDAFPLREGAS